MRCFYEYIICCQAWQTLACTKRMWERSGTWFGKPSLSTLLNVPGIHESHLRPMPWKLNLRCQPIQDKLRILQLLYGIECTACEQGCASSDASLFSAVNRHIWWKHMCRLQRIIVSAVSVDIASCRSVRTLLYSFMFSSFLEAVYYLSYCYSLAWNVVAVNVVLFSHASQDCNHDAHLGVHRPILLIIWCSISKSVVLFAIVLSCRCHISQPKLLAMGCPQCKLF